MTGSAARGTAGPASDLDLWVLRPGPRSREHLAFGGENVTLLFDAPGGALERDWLGFWEVDDLVVLADPFGHFARVRATFARHRARIRRDVLAATREDLRHLVAFAGTGSAWRRILFLREIAFRLAATWLFLRTGWRVPRLTLLLASLPRQLRLNLTRALDLPSHRAARALLSNAPATLGATARRLHRAGHPAAPFAAAPQDLRARLAAGDVGETVHLLRRHLLQTVLPAVLDGAPAPDLPALASSHAPLVALTLHLHRLDGIAVDDVRAVARTGAAVRRLASRGDLGPVLGRRLVRLLEQVTRPAAATALP